MQYYALRVSTRVLFITTCSGELFVSFLVDMPLCHPLRCAQLILMGVFDPSGGHGVILDIEAPFEDLSLCFLF